MLVVFSVGVVPVFLGWLNGDVAYLLHLAGLVLDGAVLYQDVIEVNPPLIIWLNLPPVLVARTLGVSEILAYRLAVLALLGASLALSGWVLRRVFPGRVAARRGMLLLLLIVLLPLVGSDFGQREHLMLALVLPYLLAAAARVMEVPLVGPLAWLAGAMAGVGFSIKPHFALLWLFVEGYLAWSRRGGRIWLRPEGTAAVILGAANVAAVLTLTPDYPSLLLKFKDVYSGYFKMSFLSMSIQLGTLLSMSALLGLRIVRPRGVVRGLCRVLMLANLSFLCEAFVQRKGWSYHFYPATASAVLLIGLLGAEACRDTEHRVRVIGRLLGFVLVGLALLYSVQVAFYTANSQRALRWGEGEEGRVLRLTTEHAEGRSIYVMSDLGGDAFPLVNYSRTRWGYRFPSLWALPALYHGVGEVGQPIRYRSMGEMGDLEKYLIDSVVDGLLREPPELLIVDVTPDKPRFGGRRFDYLEYFSRDSRFASLLRGYEPLADLETFRVYRRRPR